MNGGEWSIKAFKGPNMVGGVFATDPPTGQIVNLANPFGGGPSAFGTGVNIIDNNSNTPYMEQVTLGVQQQFGNNFVLSVDRLHDRGYRQLVPRFLRSLPAGVDPTYIACPNGRDPCTIIDPVKGLPPATRCPSDPTSHRVTDFMSVGRTWYDGLLISFKKRPGSGPWRPGV